MRLLLCLLFLSSSAIAGITRDDVYGSRKKEFSFEEVCKKLTKRDSPLIEVKSITYLDCMGEETRVGKYCEEALVTDPYYLRAYIDEENKKVVCQSGREVIVKYVCMLSSDKEYCDTAEIGCELLREKLAYRLKVNNASVLLNKSGKKELNCVFSPQDIKPLRR